jgi:ribosomal protein S12 methylthiotransferase accessory factor
VHTLIDHALYYVPPDRAEAFDFLRHGAASVQLSDLEEPKDPTLARCAARLAASGLRVAIADVTAPDVAGSPFRVARALGADIQPIDFGYTQRRLANPRLKALLSTDVNPFPHPLA